MRREEGVRERRGDAMMVVLDECAPPLYQLRWCDVGRFQDLGAENGLMFQLGSTVWASAKRGDSPTCETGTRSSFGHMSIAGLPRCRAVRTDDIQE